MTDKFTPGPWEACHDGKCKCKQVWSVTADHPVAVIESGEWGDSHWEAELVDGEAKLVWVLMPYGEIPQEAAEANARLIAAAPDLLEALENFMAKVSPLNDTPEAVAARAAIARARGVK